MSSEFTEGKTYSREAISERLGGSRQSYLPQVNNEVVCACLRRDLNPDAPDVILVGIGEDRERKADLLSNQTDPIPVFVRERSSEWCYVGEYRFQSSTTDPEVIARHAQRAGLEGEVTRVVRLRPERPVAVFHEDDTAYHAWMEDHPDGFVLNAGRSPSSTFAVFHESGCSHIGRYSEKWQDRSYTNPKIKVCSTSSDALRHWVRDKRRRAAENARRCKDCKPDVDVTFLGTLYPDEADLTEFEGGVDSQTEGAVKQVLVNRRERSAANRKACIHAWGTDCQVCGVDFGARYGDDIGAGFIHVHHLNPLSKGERRVDPVDDMRPVCPNCHSMLHQKSPPFTIEEMQSRLGV